MSRNDPPPFLWFSVPSCLGEIFGLRSAKKWGSHGGTEGTGGDPNEAQRYRDRPALNSGLQRPISYRWFSVPLCHCEIFWLRSAKKWVSHGGTKGTGGDPNENQLYRDRPALNSSLQRPTSYRWFSVPLCHCEIFWLRSARNGLLTEAQGHGVGHGGGSSLTNHLLGRTPSSTGNTSGSRTD